VQQFTEHMTMHYYLVAWPCDLAPYAAAFEAARPGNVLSVNVSAAGTRAIIKAPPGIQSGALEVFDRAPVALVASAEWGPQ
jgi:hypothetical protein